MPATLQKGHALARPPGCCCSPTCHCNYYTNLIDPSRCCHTREHRGHAGVGRSRCSARKLLHLGRRVGAALADAPGTPLRPALGALCQHLQAAAFLVPQGHLQE